MKTFAIEAIFLIEAVTKEEAERISCAMQQKANDEGRPLKGFLLINEAKGIAESKVVINDDGGITIEQKGVDFF